MTKYLYDRNTNYYIENTYNQFSDLEVKSILQHM